MAFTYTGPNTDLEKVRFLIGDTLSTDPLLTDAEITYLLSVWGSVKFASIAGCDAIAAKFSREADKTIGSLSLSLSNRAKAYRELASTLRASSTKIVTAYCGGISVTDKQLNSQDADRESPLFAKGRMNEDLTTIDDEIETM